jgi:hypothetical protein
MRGRTTRGESLRQDKLRSRLVQLCSQEHEFVACGRLSLSRVQLHQPLRYTLINRQSQLNHRQGLEEALELTENPLDVVPSQGGVFPGAFFPILLPPHALQGKATETDEHVCLSAGRPIRHWDCTSTDLRHHPRCFRNVEGQGSSREADVIDLGGRCAISTALVRLDEGPVGQDDLSDAHDRVGGRCGLSGRSAVGLRFGERAVLLHPARLGVRRPKEEIPILPVPERR